MAIRPQDEWRDQAHQVDAPLVQQLLELMQDYSGIEIAALVPGVTMGDVSRWRRGTWRTLSRAKRRAIKTYLRKNAQLADLQAELFSHPLVGKK